MKFLASVILLSLLAACGETAIKGTKVGATQAEFSNDLLECRAMAQRVFHYEDQSAIVQCMQGKHWAVEIM